jgi:DASS family divalent anion:Na+ symporter
MADALKTTGFVHWFADQVHTQVTGLAPVLAAVTLALVYFYSMYAFSMLTGHILAFVGVFMTVASSAGSPPLLIVPLLAYFSNLCGCTTHYSSGPIIIYFGLGYVTVARWFAIGFIVSFAHLAVWLGVGLPYWKLLGWW